MASPSSPSPTAADTVARVQDVMQQAFVDTMYALEALTPEKTKQKIVDSNRPA